MCLVWSYMVVSRLCYIMEILPLYQTQTPRLSSCISFRCITEWQHHAKGPDKQTFFMIISSTISLNIERVLLSTHKLKKYVLIEKYFFLSGSLILQCKQSWHNACPNCALCLWHGSWYFNNKGQHSVLIINTKQIYGQYYVSVRRSQFAKTGIRPSQDYAKTDIKLTQDYAKTEIRLSQDYAKTGIRLSQDYAKKGIRLIWT